MIPSARRLAATVASVFVAALGGCANPGLPKPPSLHLAAVVTDLKAIRRGDTVELQFTLPQRTSDGVALPSGTLTARLCRAVEGGPCVPLGMQGAFPVPSAPKTPAVLRDALSGSLLVGAPRLLTYRVALVGKSGRDAGYSNPAYTVAGQAPSRVEGLQAEGTRLGALLRWQPADADAAVILTREDLQAKASPTAPARPGAHARNTQAGKRGFGSQNTNKPLPRIVMLDANGGSTAEAAQNHRATGMTLDTSAVAETPYRYSAERRAKVQVGGQTLEVWSAASPPISFTLHDTFPPPAPTNLSVAGFTEPDPRNASAAYAVDLIWEPVQDEQLAGYRVYRQLLGPQSTGGATTEESRKQLLTNQPVTLPSFHDATASGSARYRYSVTSVDLKGNESEAVSAELEPQRR